MQRAVGESEVRERLSRQAGSTPILSWDGKAETLPALLSGQTLAALDCAFKPRRRVARNLADLQSQFSVCRTREEFETAFGNWLHGEDNPADDDEIELL